MRRDTTNKEDDDIAYIIGATCGILFMICLIGLIIFIIDQPIKLNQETGDDICRNLTGNESAVASSHNGKLKCKLPSYDATQNIIIEKNNE